MSRQGGYLSTDDDKPKIIIKLKGVYIMTTTICTANYYDEIKEEIMNQLENVALDELIGIWNTYASENDDTQIWENTEGVLEMLSGSLIDTIQRIKYGDFSFNDDYFAINGYGNYESFYRLADNNCPIDFEVLADWLTENDRFEEFDEIDLSDFLDELEEQEEEQEDGE